MTINYQEELNPSQFAAVEYCDGPSLVIAGAGSGKTRVLTYKIAYLLEQGYEPWSIMALTFTNKAAKEMRERIAARVGEERARMLWMNTFHSVFAKILRREALYLGYEPNFTIYDQSDSKSLVRSIIKEMQLDEKLYKPSTVAERISSAKSNMIYPEDYARDGERMNSDQRSRIPSVYKIYTRYCERCRQANAMDFDDLLINTYRLFDEHPEVLERYSERFKYVLVDEFQDTNYVQGCIVWQLTKSRRKVCVVGDDAQSIYSFRGANIDNILGFTKRYTEAKIFKLEQNYRSTQNIVNAANSLIAKNSEQIRKNVFSELSVGEPLMLKQAYSEIRESEIVVNDIVRMHRNGSLRYGDFAVLYRTNAQSRVFEETLRKYSIPYRIYGGLSFYQRKEIKDVIAYFRVICNPHDEEALKRIINYPARGIGETTVRKLCDTAHSVGVSIWTVLEAPDKYGLNLNKGGILKLATFTGMMKELINVAQCKDAYETADMVVRRSGIYSELENDHTVEALSQKENINELCSAIDAFVKRRDEESNSERKLSDFLAEVSLVSNVEDEEEQGPEKVSLMTIHSAKGLEFKVVFVVGAEDGLLPKCSFFSGGRELEEERRLFYVAITRAMEYCIITYSTERRVYTSSGPEQMKRKISPFVGDIDRAYIRMAGGSVGLGTQTSSGAPTFALTNRARIVPTAPTEQRRIVPPQRLQRIAPSAPASPASSAGNPLRVGVLIEHDRFGVGEVVNVEGSGDNAKATIKFRNVGTKQLLLKFARYKIIG
ncbi:MAG: ATP-dependent DNA helicase [Bacteroidales bacterium]|nr:ATP-dependent DNA helicase [Bacteroidales bacterium]